MSKELLDNVSTIETAIKYLKGNPYIKNDSYSMEALYYIENALERAKKVEEFISLCYVETMDTGHEVVFWRDENYEYAKQLLKMLKEELK